MFFKNILSQFLIVKYRTRREIRCPREEVFEAALDESSCRLEAALFRKKRRKKTTARLPVVGSRSVSGMSLWNGMWHDLRHGIIYAKYDTCGMT